MMFDIVSVGSATLDAFLKSNQFPLTPEVVGSKIEVDDLLLASGGGGSNTAAGFSRLGLRTALIARFGEDLFGNLVVEDLKKEEFDTQYLVQRKDDQTDFSTILVNPDGSRTVLVHRGKTRIDESIFPWEILDQTGWLYLASLEGNVDLLAKVVEKAVEKQVKVAFNPGSRELKTGGEIAQIFPKLKVLILNESEAKMFSSETDTLKAFDKVADLGAGITVVTCGRSGAYLRNGDNRLFAEIFSVPAVDETGAGDAFSTGFIGGLVKGLTLENSLKLGMAESASVVSAVGCKTGLLKQGEIDSWLEKPLGIKKLE